jgi:hypothetical protein
VQSDLFAPPTLAPILGPMAPGFRLRRASVSVEDLIATVSRYLGEERTRGSFASFAAARRLSLEPGVEADFQLLQYAEYLLASAIGAASSRLVLSLLLRKRTVSTKAALKLLDEAILLGRVSKTLTSSSSSSIASRNTPPKSSLSWSVSPSEGFLSRCAPTACPMAAW